jgi:epoxyqueuosine reductase
MPDPTVEDLRQLLADFVSTYCAGTENSHWWREPLLVTATADRRFDALPLIADKNHLLPAELLPEARSVIVFFIPFQKRLVDENSPGKFPCIHWSLAYQETNALIQAAASKLCDYLETRGQRCALTPVTHNFDPVRLVSRWSHKHMAYLSGLGTFGINAQLITPKGCSGRLGSLVTTAELGDHPLVHGEALCRHKAGEKCLKCLQRCPVQAVTENGIDRQRCYSRLKVNLKHSRRRGDPRLQETTHVCAKCAVGVPCAFHA